MSVVYLAIILKCLGKTGYPRLERKINQIPSTVKYFNKRTKKGLAKNKKSSIFTIDK
jgi:hypothetical protein